METLERVRGGGRMPLLMLGEAGRWERFQTDQDNCWDTDEEKEKNNGELDIRASVVVESEKDQSVNDQRPCLKPEYCKAPTRIKSKTASPQIFSRRRAVTSGLFLLRLKVTVVLSMARKKVHTKFFIYGIMPGKRRLLPTNQINFRRFSEWGGTYFDLKKFVADFYISNGHFVPSK